MSSSNKVFIYTNQGVDPSCASDLKHFFEESRGIFKQRPDVVTFDSPFNTDGLLCPTIAVPGGSSTAIGCKLKPILAAIRSGLGENFNYVGVCAGGFIGTAEADLFMAMPQLDRECAQRRGPSFGCGKTSFSQANLGLIDEFKAIGSFYPLNDIRLSPEDYTPYCVSLTYSETGQTSKQLHCGGPGFFAVKNHTTTTNVVATYTDRTEYPFFYHNGHVERVKSLSAVLSRKHEGNRGGVFLSGTHFEATVQDSQLLEACRTGVKGELAALSDSDYATLVENNPSTKKTVEDLLSRTLK